MSKIFLRQSLRLVSILGFLLIIFIGFNLNHVFHFINVANPQVLWVSGNLLADTNKFFIADKNIYIYSIQPIIGAVPIIVLDKDTGEEKRRIPINYSLSESSHPSVVKNTMYFSGIDNKDHKFRFIALNVQNGQTLWSVDANADLSGEALPINNIVLVERADAYPTSSSTLTAYDLYAGKQLWMQQIPEKASNFAERQGVIYVQGSETLYAYAAESGQRLWQRSEPGWLQSKPVVADGTIYSAMNQRVYAIDSADGKEKWEYSLMGKNEDIGSSPVIQNGVLFVKSNKKLYALDGNNGREISNTKLDFTAPWGISADDSNVYYTDYYGICIDSCSFISLHALNVSEKREKWRFDIPGGYLSQFAEYDGVTYVLGKKLYAIK